MRKVTLLTILFTFLSMTVLHAQSESRESIEWIEIDRALQLADQNDKKILIDVFAEWCPYCQKMQSEIYPSREVTQKVNSHFVAVRINVESESEVQFLGNSLTQAEFARALRYQSVPTTYFMNENGEIIGQQPGLLSKEIFTKLLSFVGSDAYLDQDFEAYEMEEGQ